MTDSGDWSTASSPRALFVCDAGGHLMEAHVMRDLLYGDTAARFYTADTLMSRTMLSGEDAVFATRRVLPRRPDLAARELFTALRLLRRWRPDVVVSTGSAVALPWLSAAKLLRLRAVFHESAARFDGLSLTGKLIGFVPGVERHTQTPIRRRGWTQSVSSLAIAGRAGATVEPPPTKTVFVSVGTYEYPFTRLFEQVEEMTPPDWQIIWQLGHAGGYRPGRGEVHDFLPYDEVLDAMRRAQTIVTHAGVGSVLSSLQAGRLPIVVPRRAGHGEHADDHQTQLLDHLRAVGITALDDVADLTTDVIVGRAPAAADSSSVDDDKMTGAGSDVRDTKS